jgi:hypothetical protein
VYVCDVLFWYCTTQPNIVSIFALYKCFVFVFVFVLIFSPGAFNYHLFNNAYVNSEIFVWSSRRGFEVLDHEKFDRSLLALRYSQTFDLCRSISKRLAAAARLQLLPGEPCPTFTQFGVKQTPSGEICLFATLGISRKGAEMTLVFICKIIYKQLRLLKYIYYFNYFKKEEYKSRFQK